MKNIINILNMVLQYYIKNDYNIVTYIHYVFVKLEEQYD